MRGNSHHEHGAFWYLDSYLKEVTENVKVSISSPSARCTYPGWAAGGRHPSEIPSILGETFSAPTLGIDSVQILKTP